MTRLLRDRGYRCGNFGKLHLSSAYGRIEERTEKFEEVKAVVQPLDGVEPGPELERELIAFCRENLSTYKCPRTIDFDPELPRLPTGKLYKRLLKDEYWAGQWRIVQRMVTTLS